MFDEARTQLTDVLYQNNAALTIEEAEEAIPAGSLVAEQVLNQHATTEEVDGQRYVVAVDDSDEFAIPSNGAAADDTDAADGADEDTETEADPDPSPAEQTVPQPADDAWEDDETEVYNVNGLRIDVNPSVALAGTPTGRDVYGARELTNSHPGVPETTIPYYPVDLGERDTEEMFYRGLSLHLPMILEGEAGTGKNHLADVAASRLNLPKYRQSFGSDTSVFDVVGEKDLLDDSTYMVLGTAAKAAMFGGIYIADEINMATGSVTSYLHPLFERKGKRSLELRGTGRTLRDLPEGVDWDPSEHLGEYIHPDFYAVGTCNPLHYADTQEMNDALRSRCLVIEHPYLCNGENDVRLPNGNLNPEAHLLADETGCDPEDVEDLLRAVAVLREARREGNAITSPIGHRELRDTVELAGPDEGWMSFKAAAKTKIVGQASLKNDKQYIADTLEDEL